MNNRLHNCGNPYQTEAKRVLCVCSAGLLRSPTTANVLHREYGYNTRAAGIDVDHALVPVDVVLIKWADEIVCMDQWQAARIADIAKLQGFEPPVIKTLHVPDNYAWMDETLQGIILESYREQEVADAVHG